MSINMSTPGVEIARYAGAMYGIVLDDATVVSVENAANANPNPTAGLNAVVNAVYTADFGSATNASVAATVATNLGLTGTLSTEAQAYIVAQLNAASAGTQGATIMSILNMFGQMTSDPTWGAAATAWENRVSAAVTYGQNSGNTSNSVISAMSPVAPPVIYNLTTGVDTLGSSTMTGAQTFNAGTADSLSAFDKLTGNGNASTSLNADVTGTALPGSMTITGIPTATIQATGAGYTADVSGWTGLTNFTLNDSAAGAQVITAAATTNVTDTDTVTGSSVTVNGGLAVTTTSNGGNVNIGGTTAPSGAVSVTESSAGITTVGVQGGTNVTVTTTGSTQGVASTEQITIGAAVGTPGTATTTPTGTVTVNATTGTVNGNGIGLITVNGGTVVTVTETAGNAASATNNTTEGNVAVNGTSATNTVVVNQTATAAGVSAAAAVTGVLAASAVSAAPGVQGVTAVSGISGSAAVAGVVGTTAGTVTIKDANHASGTAANTITSVTLDNYGNSTIASNALANLSLTGVAGTLGITNANTAAMTAKTSSLALTVNNLSGTNTITDVNNEIKTLNVTTTGADSTLAAFADTSLATLTVAGSNVLNLSALNSSLTSISVSGAAGFNDGATTHTTGFAALGSAATFTTTSSGAINITLNDTAQTFTGSTGTDTITISDLADATKVVTGGSAGNNELILEGGAYALTSATAAKVTGFQTLGLAANVTGPIDVSVLGNFSTIDILGNSTIVLNKVTQNASLNLDAASTAVTLNYKDASGVNDVVTVNDGVAGTTTAGFTTTALTLADANGVGIGTVNLVSSGSTWDTVQPIATLTDNGLANLNVSGTAGLTINTLDEATTQATTFTLNNTETGGAGVTITGFTDNNLGSLVFKGANASTITTLTDAGAVFSVSNTGSSTASVGTLSDNSLTSLTLGAGVSLGQASTADNTKGLQDTSTAGVTVSGSSDNNHVTINLAGAATGNTDSITLGNGNNFVTDGSIAGTVNVTVGTGSNLIVLGGTNTDTTGVYNVTLGSHSAATGIDSISIGSAGTAFATVPNLVVTGAVAGDQIVFSNDVAANTVLAAVTAGSTAAATITAVETAASAGAHDVAYSVFGGNTYVAESLALAAASATNTTMIELIGTHTVTAATGHVVVA